MIGLRAYLYLDVPVLPKSFLLKLEHKMVQLRLLFQLANCFYAICWLHIFRPDTLDPALLRPGRLDRKVEFGLPDLESRTQIFKIHTRTMNCERDIRFELLARLCPNSTGMLKVLGFFISMSNSSYNRNNVFM